MKATGIERLAGRDTAGQYVRGAAKGSVTKWLNVTLSAISGLAITVAFLDMRSYINNCENWIKSGFLNLSLAVSAILAWVSFRTISTD